MRMDKFERVYCTKEHAEAFERKNTLGLGFFRDEDGEPYLILGELVCRIT